MECLDKISHIVNKVQTFDQFSDDWIFQDAMVRNFEIIGEASVHLSDELKEKYSEIEWHKVKGMRNFLVHEYFGVELDEVWQTAIKDIPILHEHIKQIIKGIENA